MAGAAEEKEEDGERGRGAPAGGGWARLVPAAAESRAAAPLSPFK